MAIVNFLFRAIAATIGGTLTLISGILTAAITIFTGSWTFFSALLQGDWKTAWLAILTTLQSVTATLTATAQAFMEGVLSIVGTNLDAFAASWAGTFDLAGQILSKFGADIVVWISQGILGAIAAAQALVGGFTDLGAAIIDGMVSGITNAAAGLASAAVNAVAGALSAAKGALGVHSPSTVFAGLGMNMMAGMAQGILGGMGQPVGAMQAVSNSVINSGGNTHNYYGVQADTQAAYTRALAGAF